MLRDFLRETKESFAHIRLPTRSHRSIHAGLVAAQLWNLRQSIWPYNLSRRVSVVELCPAKQRFWTKQSLILWEHLWAITWSIVIKSQPQSQCITNRLAQCSKVHLPLISPERVFGIWDANWPLQLWCSHRARLAACWPGSPKSPLRSAPREYLAWNGTHKSPEKYPSLTCGNLALRILGKAFSPSTFDQEYRQYHGLWGISLSDKTSTSHFGETAFLWSGLFHKMTQVSYQSWCEGMYCMFRVSSLENWFHWLSFPAFRDTRELEKILFLSLTLL